MKRVASGVLGALAMCAIAAPAVADPITVVAATRAVTVSQNIGTISSSGEPQFNQDALSNATGLVRPDGSARSAGSLFSQILGDPTFNGHGETSASFDSTVSAGAEAHASYFVAFDVNATQQYTFAANFSTTGTDATDRSLWGAQLFFFPNGPNPRTAFSFSGGDTRSLLSSGLLGPGRYGFEVFSGSDSGFGSAGSGAASGAFNFSLEFSDPAVSATPEPASMLLLGTGVAGLFARRRMQGAN